MAAPLVLGHRRVVHDGGQRRTAVVYGASSNGEERGRLEGTGRTRSSPRSQRCRRGAEARSHGDGKLDDARWPDPRKTIVAGNVELQDAIPSARRTTTTRRSFRCSAIRSGRRLATAMLNDVHGGSGLGFARERETWHGGGSKWYREREEHAGNLIHHLGGLGGDENGRGEKADRVGRYSLKEEDDDLSFLSENPLLIFHLLQRSPWFLIPFLF